MHGQQNVKICHEFFYKSYLVFDVFIITFTFGLYIKMEAAGWHQTVVNIHKYVASYLRTEELFIKCLNF